MGLSLIILAAAFREAVPGRELPGRALSALIIMACAAFVLFNSGAQRPPSTSTHDWMHWVWECVYMTISFSIPALAAPGWLVARALPNRPALAGALCGLGVGIMADAGLKLFCWDGGTHLIVAHGGAIVLLVMLGATCATLVERIKARSNQR
jgi:hypothetical protein